MVFRSPIHIKLKTPKPTKTWHLKNEWLSPIQWTKIQLTKVVATDWGNSAATMVKLIEIKVNSNK